MARKPLTDPRTWFERASYFHYSGLTLLGMPRQSPALAYPAITLQAFAAEAYFKCLIILEESGKLADLHDLVILYARLSPETRKLIRKEWDELSRPHLLKARKSASEIGVPVPTTLQQALEQSRNAFIDWRYHSKGSTLGFTIGMVPTLARKRILHLKPDWRPIPPDMLSEIDPDIGISKAKAEMARGTFITSKLDDEGQGLAVHFRVTPDTERS